VSLNTSTLYRNSLQDRIFRIVHPTFLNRRDINGRTVLEEQLEDYFKNSSSVNISSVQECWMNNSKYSVWQRITEKSRSIKAHTAIAEGMFSSLRLIKTKSRNKS
jgi:hypothetical protein